MGADSGSSSSSESVVVVVLLLLSLRSARVQHRRGRRAEPRKLLPRLAAGQPTLFARSHRLAAGAVGGGGGRWQDPGPAPRA
ncbi:hypothetical protein F5X96DRAFT_662015 [Biscogniauxia mediterranea]|nr:hypothetical protein F5X96DRAFT_662015 [Biscogniauxia mediterranea]